MAGTFNFAPERNVPVTLPRDPVKGMSLNGWQFSARPTTPYARRFQVTLHGMRWHFDPATGLYDSTTNPQFNARALEIFYEQNECWSPFIFPHQHFGDLTCRFDAAVSVPKGLVNSGGRIDAFDVTLIQHNPGY